MIEIKPNALYSRGDLAAMLEPAGVDVDHFTARLKARKVFKQVWLGADILKAFEAAPALSERPDAPELPAAANRGNRTRRRGTAPANYPGAKLDAYKQTLKDKRP